MLVWTKTGAFPEWPLITYGFYHYHTTHAPHIFAPQILAKIQANHAKAADAIMLDVEGNVSETNATNIFMVKHGTVVTPHADHCLPGITRQTVMDLCRALSIPLEERRVSLAEFYAADEAFTTGTMGELTPVASIDGRAIGSGPDGWPITRRIQREYRALTEREGEPLPF